MLLHTLYYLSEIIFTFGLFCIVLNNSILPVAYEEKSYLKRFIDFFTVYQISLFVILRIVNSHIISSYRLLLNEVRGIRNFVDSDMPIDDPLNECKREMNNYYLHPEIRLLYKEMLFPITFYLNSKKLHSIGAYDDEEFSASLKRFQASLTSKEMLLESRLANKEREWEGSIILRIIKNRELRAQRKIREKEVISARELYLSEDE